MVVSLSYVILNLIWLALVWGLVVFFSVCLVRVFLTAVDRRVGSRAGRRAAKAGREEPGTKSYSPTLLVNTPVIGAYPVEDGKGGGYAWKDVWKKLLIQLVLCVATEIGATIILRILFLLF